MDEKIGRNDPCPCGSGKKYKACCWNKRLPLSKRAFKATVISSGPKKQNEMPNLMERTFGEAVRSTSEQDSPPVPPKKIKGTKKGLEE